VVLGRCRHPYTRVLRVRNGACVPAMVQSRASAAEGGPADCLTVDPTTFAVPAESCADVRVTLAATRLGVLQAALHFSVRLEADWLVRRACSSPKAGGRTRGPALPWSRAEHVSLATWDQLFLLHCISCCSSPHVATLPASKPVVHSACASYVFHYFVKGDGMRAVLQQTHAGAAAGDRLGRAADMRRERGGRRTPHLHP